MQIKYSFINGDHSEVEVSEELGAYILDSRRRERNNDHTYQRHNYSLDRGLDDGFVYGYEDSSTIEILSAIEQLSDIQRERLMKVIEGYNAEEIALTDGHSPQAIRKCIALAKKKLADILFEDE